MRRILLLISAAWLPLLAQSMTLTPSGTAGVFTNSSGVATFEDVGTQGGEILANLLNRSFVPGSAPAVTVGDEALTALLGGNNVTVQAAQPITGAEMATAITAVAVSAYAGCAAGTAIANYAGLGSPGNGTRTGCNLTDWLYDAGQPAVTVQEYLVRIASSGAKYFNASLSTACDAAAQGYSGFVNSNYYIGTYSPGSSAIQGGNCIATYLLSKAGYPSSSSTVTVGPWSGPTAQTSCPATVDALNPAYDEPAGGPVGPDGSCPTGRYSPATPAQVAGRLAGYGVKYFAPSIGQWLMDHGQNIVTASPYVITGVSPGSVTGTPTTTTTTPPGGSPTTVTTTPQTNYQPSGSTVIITTTTTTNNNGTTTITNAPAPTSTPQPACGAPGEPECAVVVDEKGTPQFTPPQDPRPGLIAADAAAMSALASQVPTPSFGWMVAPPLAACEPFAFPNNMGSIDACGVVGDVQEAMGYIWAVAAGWLMLGMIRKASHGGA